MNNINWKKLIPSTLPHVGAIILFFILALAYNSPLMDGKRLVSHDDTQFRGAAHEVIDYRKNNHEEALWMNNMFSGMPAYTVSYNPSNNLVAKVFYGVGMILPTPAVHMFWAMLCFYILLLTFGFKPYVSAIGAVSYAFCSYNIGIVVAGHYAKFWAIAIFPLVLAGINLLFKKKYIWGALVTGVATSIEILVNHPQMTYYYFVFFLSLYLVYLFVDAILKKEIKHAFVASALSVLMILVGLGSNANKLLPTNEYAKYSTRGPSDLKQTGNVSNKTGGLDKDYIVGYSSGKDDFYSFLVPGYKGANSGVQLISNKVATEEMGKSKQLVGQVEGLVYQNYGEIIETYWGGTDIAAGGIYCSVLMTAFFLLGFIFVKSPVKWLVIPAILVTIMLSWGKNYMGFTNFFIDNFPGYNKFRAVNSIIIVATFCIPLLASFMLARLTNEPEFLEKPSFGKYKIKHVFTASMGVIVLVLLLMYAMPTAFQSFFKPAHMVDKVQQVMSEKEIITEAMTNALLGGKKIEQVDEQTAGEVNKQINEVLDSIQAGRIAIYKEDVLRSLIVMLLGTLAMGLYAFKVYNWKVMVVIVGAIVLIDVWDYDKRSLSADTEVNGEKLYQEPKNANKTFTPTPADQMIMSDSSIHKRVLNLSVSPFNDGTTSYYHQSLGGYSGAKLKRYQELVERGIYPDINRVFTGGTDKIDSLLSTAGVLNMLNTKYFIFDPNAAPLPNRYANGAAWTVSDVKFVKDADEEIGSLKNINTKTQVVVDEVFKGDINVSNLRPDSTARIKIISMSPRLLEYEYFSSADQLAVFSEIYYPAGWKAYIDGTEAKIIRVNYVLRALYVTKGKHKIEFMFEPASYKKGEMYSLIASSILVLLLLVGIGLEIRKRNKKTAKK
jgi:hypothetical protein